MNGSDKTALSGFRAATENLWYGVLNVFKILGAFLGSLFAYFVYIWWVETSLFDIFKYFAYLIGTICAGWLGLVWLSDLWREWRNSRINPSPTTEEPILAEKTAVTPEIVPDSESRGGRPRKARLNDFYEMLIDRGVIPADMEPPSFTEEEWEEMVRFWRSTRDKKQ